MDKSDIERQFSLIEAQLAFLHEVSLAPDPEQLPGALAQLQPLLSGLVSALQTVDVPLAHRPLMRHRLNRSLAMVSTLREGVMRHSAGVERALAALVPATESITYGTATAMTRRQPYGTVARQSGEFKVVSV